MQPIESVGTLSRHSAFSPTISNGVIASGVRSNTVSDAPLGKFVDTSNYIGSFHMMHSTLIHALALCLTFFVGRWILTCPYSGVPRGILKLYLNVYYLRHSICFLLQGELSCVYILSRTEKRK